MISIFQIVRLALACLAAPLASAANYYITPAGNDTHNGLSASGYHKPRTPASIIAASKTADTRANNLAPAVSASAI